MPPDAQAIVGSLTHAQQESKAKMDRVIGELELLAAQASRHGSADRSFSEFVCRPNQLLQVHERCVL